MALGLLGDVDGGVPIAVLRVPVGLDELAQGRESGLADRGVDAGVGGDIGERDGEGGVGFGVVERELGLLADRLVGRLGVGEDLNQFVVHVAGPLLW